MVDRGDWQSQSVVAQKPRCLFGQFRFSLLARTTGNTAGFLPPAQPKKDTSRVSFFWWTEVDSNHRSLRRQIYSLIHLAALESVRFARCSNASCGAGDWTRTHNLLITNQLLCQLSHIGLAVKLSGWRRIRTFESVANRFTVCPLWPLGNPSKYGTYRARTYDPLLVRQMLSQLS